MAARVLITVLALGISAKAFCVELNDAERSAIEEAVRNELKDPDSAEFKWLPLLADRGETSGTYCGLVNAKNSFGGYIGHTPYSVFLVWPEGGQPVVGVIGIATSDLDSPRTLAIRESCAKAGYDNFGLAE